MNDAAKTKTQLITELAHMRGHAGDHEVAANREHRLRESLQVSETKYRRLFEAAQDGILILDAESGRIVAVNPFLANLLDYPQQDMLGKQLWDLGPFWDVLSSRIAFKELQAKDYIRYDHLPLETSGGRRIAVEFVSNAYLVDGVRVMQCNIRDITERKAVEVSMGRLAAIVESSDDAISGTDLNGIVTDWNKGAEKTFGYTAHEMVGAAMARLIPDDRRDEESTLLERILSGESMDNWDTVRQTKDGRLINVSVTVCAIKDANGKIIGVSRVAHDTTLRKEHEREIERLSRLYAALSQVNKAIVTLDNREALFVRICRALVESGKLRMAWVGWLDAKTQQVIPVAQCGDSTNYLSKVAVYTDDRPEGQGPTGTMIREGRNYVCNDFNHDPCTLPWREVAAQAGFQSSVSLIIRLGGVICGAITVYAGEAEFFQDKEMALLEEAAATVSFALDNGVREEARRQAEMDLRWKTAFLEAQVDSTLDGILVVDDQGKKILQNQRMRELWKIPSEIAENTDDSVQIAFVASRTKDPQAFADGIVHLYSHPDEVSRDEVELTDGTCLDRYSSPVRDKAGVHYGRIWTFRDITARKQLEAQYLQAQKMESVGRLAGGVAHDFNNLLTVINSTAELAAMQLRPSDPLQQDIAEIRRAGTRAGALTKQLLAFSRKQVLQPQAVNLTALLTDLQPLLQRLIGEDVALPVVLAEDLGSVRVDPGQIEQVIVNLAVNARDAMPNGGTFTTETRNVEIDESYASTHPSVQPGPYVMLALSDTGIGMDEATRQRLFEPFFTTKLPGRGTGLGLATVHGIVKQSGGNISVYSEVGMGTTFRIYLPRVAEATPKHAPVRTGIVTRGTGTILVVEDEEAVRRLAQRVLASAGYTVLVAANGEEALRALERHDQPVDLMLTDVVMPGMSGRDLVNRLKVSHADMKIIFTSGYTDDAILRRGVLDEGVHFLSKPYMIADLTQKVREVLDS